jgi:hypothetical protein
MSFQVEPKLSRNAPATPVIRARILQPRRDESCFDSGMASNYNTLAPEHSDQQGRCNLERFIVSRDDNIYEAFPDVALTPSGRLVCVLAECTHHRVGA